MFHLEKRVTTETTWEALLRQHVNLTRDIENIDNTIVVNCRRFTIVCPQERTGTEVEDHPS